MRPFLHQKTVFFYSFKKVVSSRNSRSVSETPLLGPVCPEWNGSRLPPSSCFSIDLSLLLSYGSSEDP